MNRFDSATRRPRNSSRRADCSIWRSRRSAPGSTRSGPATISSRGDTPTATLRTRLSGSARRRRPRAGNARHERVDAVVSLQPGGRRAGLRDARLPGSGSGHPGCRDRRIDERDPRRGRMAGAERAVRAAEGVGHDHPAAVRARTSSPSRASTTGPTTRRSTTGPTSRSRSTSRRPDRPPRGSPAGSATGSSAPRARARTSTPRPSCPRSVRLQSRPTATRDASSG